jgi:DNA-binding Xre family transcriptional regulator
MRWNLRMKAAERGIWKSTELRRMLAGAGLEISAGKMSGWWTGTPNSIRLDELDVLCAVLECEPSALLIPEPDTVAAGGPQQQPAAESSSSSPVKPRFGKGRSVPPV